VAIASNVANGITSGMTSGVTSNVVDLSSFNNEIINVEKQLDTNVELAFQRLIPFEEHLNELSVPQQISYYSVLAEIYILQAKYQRASEVAEQGVLLTKSLISPSISIAKLLYSRGFSAESLGDFDIALKDYESGLAIAKSNQDKELIVKGLLNIGAIYYLSDRFERSITLLNEAYSIAMKTVKNRLKGNVNAELGRLYLILRQSEKSLIYFQQAYLYYKKSGLTVNTLYTLASISISHLNSGEYQQAIMICQQILKESKNVELNEVLFSAYSGLAWANYKKGTPDLNASYHYLQIAKKYLSNTEDYNKNIQFLLDEMFILYAFDRDQEALITIAKLEKALEGKIELTRLNLLRKSKVINLKSKILFRQGKSKQAYQLQRQRLALAELMRNKIDVDSVAELRLSLEGKQADLQKKILENKRSLQRMSIIDADKEKLLQRNYLAIFTVVALLFVWRLIKLLQYQRRLHQAYSVDDLTEVANRASVLKSAEQVYRQYINSGFSVLLIDVNGLKKINEQFGASCGDQVLQTIAKQGERLLRKTDVFGRLGGGEFMVLLPKASKIQALTIAKRYQSLIHDNDWQAELGVEQNVSLTVSIGGTFTQTLASTERRNLAAVLAVASSSLKRAKSSSQNYVCG